MATTNRNEYFDILRGAAIIAVVAIHSISVGLNQPINSLDFNLTMFFRNAINFAVPVFLAISGYFLVNKNVQNTAQYISFIKKQIPKVYLPCLVWSLCWLLLSRLRGGGLDYFDVFTFQANEIYYFIFLIVQCYLLLPFLQRLATHKGLLISVAISIIMTFVIYALRYHAGINLPLIVYAGNLFTWLMFFVLGLYLGKNKIISITNAKLLLLVIITFSLSCLESYWLIDEYAQAPNAATAVKASSFLYSFCVIVLLFKNQKIFYSSILMRFGKASFGIYLIHMLPLMVIAALVKHYLPWLHSEVLLYQAFLIVSVSFLCLLGVSTINHLLPNQISRLLGFR